MFRKQVNPAMVAAAILLVLALVTAVYWRLIVYREPAQAPGGGGPMGGAPQIRSVSGLADVEVDTLAGERPDLRDGPVWAAQFCGPNDLALATDGSLYVADSLNHRIRKISPGGAVSSVAGDLPPGAAAGDGLLYPSGVAVGPGGAIYASDTGHHRIMRLVGDSMVPFASAPPGQPNWAPARLEWGGDGALWTIDAVTGKSYRIDSGGRVAAGAAPVEVGAAFGWPGGKRTELPVVALGQGGGEPEPAQLPSGRLAAAAGLGAGAWVAVAADTGAAFLVRDGGQLLLLAGRLIEGQKMAESLDGEGNRATFGFPADIVRLDDRSFAVADYGGNRIRRLTLPEWLVEGREMPRRRRPDFQRRRR